MDLRTRVWPQYLLAVAANMGTLSFGLTIGWLAPLQRGLMSSDSPLGPDSQPLTLTEISWIGAMPTIALIVSTPMFGYLLQKVGRKKSALIANLPGLVAYPLLLCAHHVNVVYLARFIAGFGSAGCLITTPIYVNECSQDNIRGLLGSLSGLFINLGVIVAFTFGGFTSYTSLNLVCMSFTLVFLLAYPWLPESPAYLLSTDRPEEAALVMVKLRGGSKADMDVELNEMIKATKLRAGVRTSLWWVLRDRVARRGMVIVTGLYTIQQLSGVAAILGYLVYILDTSGTNINSNLAASLSAVVQLTGSTTGVMLIDRMGRKALLLFSALSMFFSLVTFTVFVAANSYTESSLLWIPPLSLMAYIFTYAVGFGTVPFVLLPELFSPDIRGVAVSFVGTYISILCFLVSFAFPLLSTEIHLYGCFAIFSLFSLAGVVFVYFLVFETKGKSTAEILDLLQGVESKPREVVPLKSDKFNSS